MSIFDTGLGRLSRKQSRVLYIVGCGEHKEELDMLLQGVYEKSRGRQPKDEYAEILKSFKTVKLFNGKLPKPKASDVENMRVPRIPLTTKQSQDIQATRAAHTLTHNIAGNFVHLDALDDCEQAIAKRFKHLVNGSAEYTRAVNNVLVAIHWLNTNVINDIKAMQGLIVLTGDYTASKDWLIYIAQSLGLSVLCISTDKGCGNVDDELYDIIDLGTPDETYIFNPSTTRQVHTTAYKAQKEIRQQLYDGKTYGLYEEYQYKYNRVLELKSTLDELDIYWSQHAMLRPGFNIDDDVVDVPAFLCQIAGCDFDLDTYFDRIARLTDNVHGYGLIKISGYSTILRIDDTSLGCVEGWASTGGERLWFNGELNKRQIIKHNKYRYGHLPMETQHFILDKIQELIDSNIFKGYSIETHQTLIDRIITAGLNLPTELIQLIQWFDFTKRVPKIICLDEGYMSIQDAIVLALLHLMAFDIAIFTPSKNASMLQYLDTDCVQIHVIGAPNFSVNMAQLNSYLNNTASKKAKRKR